MNKPCCKKKETPLTSLGAHDKRRRRRPCRELDIFVFFVKLKLVVARRRSSSLTLSSLAMATFSLLACPLLRLTLLIHCIM
jgi:hypothetical protein